MKEKNGFTKFLKRTLKICQIVGERYQRATWSYSWSLNIDGTKRIRAHLIEGKFMHWGRTK